MVVKQYKILAVQANIHRICLSFTHSQRIITVRNRIIVTITQVFITFLR